MTAHELTQHIQDCGQIMQEQYGQAQYLKDLATLESRPDQNYCFFAAMGELSASRWNKVRAAEANRGAL